MSLKRKNRHYNFWIEDGYLFESYMTIRGLRYLEVAKVDYPDRESLNEVDELIVASQIINKQ